MTEYNRTSSIRSQYPIFPTISKFTKPKNYHFKVPFPIFVAIFMVPREDVLIPKYGFIFSVSGNVFFRRNYFYFAPFCLIHQTFRTLEKAKISKLFPNWNSFPFLTKIDSLLFEREKTISSSLADNWAILDTREKLRPI